VRAAIFRNGEIVVDQMPEPKPGPGMVLVKSLACGICGSDLHARKHAHRMVELAKHFPGRKPMDLSRDVVFGHEFCCEVLDYGPGTTGKFKPGAKVCSLPALLTAEGPQGIGYSNDNVGAYAERMLLSEALLLEVPNGLAAEHAALTEPLAVGVHAVAKANIRGGEVPLVIGCGPVGLAVIAALKIKGMHPIVAADYSLERLLIVPAEQSVPALVITVDAGSRPLAHVSWDPVSVPGLAGLRLYRDQGGSTDVVEAELLPPSATSVVDSSLTAGATVRYFFTIGGFTGGATDTPWQQFTMTGGGGGGLGFVPTRTTRGSATYEEYHVWSYSSSPSGL